MDSKLLNEIKMAVRLTSLTDAIVTALRDIDKEELRGMINEYIDTFEQLKRDQDQKEEKND